MNRSTTDHLAATVLITTKDRWNDLERAIASVLSQSVPVEFLVVDDGSSDGTSEMIREQFPEIKLLRNKQSMGIIAARNHAAHQATTDILFTLDDDATYSDVDVVKRAIQDIQHPRVGAVAIPVVNYIGDQLPMVDPYLEDTTKRQTEDFLCTFSYRGCANAVRRGLFLQLGGYEGTGRQGEEHTYCAKLLSAGYVVRVASHGHVNHYQPALKRDVSQLVEYHALNGIEFSWNYVPFPQLLLHLPASCWGSVKASIRRRRFWRGMRGLKNGLLGIFLGKYSREPMTRSNYRLMRKMIKNDAMPLSSLEPVLNAPLPHRATEPIQNLASEKLDV